MGLGLENFSLAQYLIKYGFRATVLDKRTTRNLGDRYKKLKAAAFNFLCGPDYLKYIKNFDVIFKTPGFSGRLKQKNGAVVTTPMELFFDLCPAKIIAVTGTKGKGTIASLIFEILKSTGKNVWLAGNIGKAPFDFIDKLKKNHFVVLELSSFQLLNFNKQPYISIVTNLLPEHLAPADPQNPAYHKSLKEYYAAKANIFLNQQKNDWLVVNKNNHHSEDLLKKTKARILYFETNHHLPQNLYLIGRHNRENIAAAYEVAKLLRIPTKQIKYAIKNFKGLEHHLEFVSEINGVRFYNDSASTMTQATLAAVGAFDRNTVLIVGGVNKGYDLVAFTKKLITLKNLKAIILIGKTSLDLEKNLKKLNPPFKIVKEVKNIIDIINKSIILSRDGDIVLFSPGFASFDMFKNYKDRGEKFKKAIFSIKKQSG